MVKLTTYMDGDYESEQSGQPATSTTNRTRIMLGSVHVATVEKSLPASGGSATTSIYYQLTNQIGSSTITTDKTGAVVQAQDTKPYGGYRVNIDTKNIKDYYALHERDQETSLTYMNARMYTETGASFLSLDPTSQYYPSSLLSDPQQLNLYAYARGNPIRYNDPSGNSFAPPQKPNPISVKSVLGKIASYFSKGSVSTGSSTKIGVPATPFAGLASPKTATSSSKTSTSWMDAAKKETRTIEIVGKQNNSRVLEYHSIVNGPKNDDENGGWCSSFVNWSFAQVGITGSKSASAGSWGNWGQTLDKPAYGAVGIVNGGTHVGFVAGYSATGKIILLGGNQGNPGAVRYSPFPVSDITQYVYPSNYTPNYSLQTYKKFTVPSFDLPDE